jgi:hypothetical protein
MTEVTVAKITKWVSNIAIEKWLSTIAKKTEFSV